VGLFIVFGDLQALLTYFNIKKTLSEKEKTIIKSSALDNIKFYLRTLIYLIGTACYIYEIYYDFLIFWIGVYNVNNLLFGFCAIIFPFLNRLLHIILCVKLFINGIRSRTRSIKP
jgi:hypothetical protein